MDDYSNSDDIYSGKDVVHIDLGSRWCRIGSTFEDFSPRLYIPTVIGTSEDGHEYFGEEAVDNKESRSLTFSHPVESGIVQNWTEAEKFLDSIWDENHMYAVDESFVLMSEAPLNPKKNRENMLEYMLEKREALGLCLKLSTELAFLPYGCANGLSLESGYNSTYVVPIYNGHAIRHAIQRIDLGGTHVTKTLENIITNKGIRFEKKNSKGVLTPLTAKEKEEELERVKEKYGIVGLPGYEDYEPDDPVVCTIGEDTFELNDTERYAMSDTLFKVTSPISMQQIVVDCISKCDPEIRSKMYENIILSSGSCHLPFFAQRLEDEIYALAQPNARVDVSYPESLEGIWDGACQLASTKCFEDMCITKKEYEEYGVSIVHTKC